MVLKRKRTSRFVCILLKCIFLNSKRVWSLFTKTKTNNLKCQRTRDDRVGSGIQSRLGRNLPILEVVRNEKKSFFFKTQAEVGVAYKSRYSKNNIKLPLSKHLFRSACLRKIYNIWKEVNQQYCYTNTLKALKEKNLIVSISTPE